MPPKTATGYRQTRHGTFVKWMLMDATPPDEVAVLTGHRGFAIWIEHYSSWKNKRQRQVEVEVRRVWAEKYCPTSSKKKLKRPESTIQTLYSDSFKCFNWLPTARFRWWRRGELNNDTVLIPCNLLISLSALTALTALAVGQSYKNTYTKIDWIASS
jgi:hypothetical protein